MSKILWPKINPVDFDPNKMTEQEAELMVQAAQDLAMNPVWQIHSHAMQTLYDNLGSVDYLLDNSISLDSAKAARHLLIHVIASINNVESM